MEKAARHSQIVAFLPQISLCENKSLMLEKSLPMSPRAHIRIDQGEFVPCEHTRPRNLKK